MRIHQCLSVSSVVAIAIAAQFSPAVAADVETLKWSKAAERFLGPYVMLVPASRTGTLTLFVAPNDGIFPTNLQETAQQATVRFDIEIAPDGAVVASAAQKGKPVALRLGDQGYFETALKAWRFRPLSEDRKSFRVENIPVFVARTPSLTGEKIRYPNAAAADLRIRLLHSDGSDRGGLGSEYMVDVIADGTVTYNGEGTGVAITGKHVSKIDPSHAQNLFYALTNINPIQQKGGGGRTFHGWDYVSVEVATGDRTILLTRQLSEANFLSKPPNELTRMGRMIREVADVERWTKGNAATIPNLIAENWNFRSDQPPNTNFIDGVARWGEVGVLRELIARGVPFTATDRLPQLPYRRYMDQTPLEYAATRGKGEMVLALLAASSDWSPRALTNAMLSIAKFGTLDAVGALVKAGADPRDPGAGRYKGTLLDQAAASGDPDLVRYALSRGGNAREFRFETTVLHHLTGGFARPEKEPRPDRAQALKLLLAAGADANAHNDLGFTPIMWAGTEDLTRILIDAGADVMARSNSGQTALMSCHSPGAARMLLDAGADISATTNRGMSVRQYVRQVCWDSQSKGESSPGLFAVLGIERQE